MISFLSINFWLGRLCQEECIRGDIVSWGLGLVFSQYILILPIFIPNILRGSGLFARASGTYWFYGLLLGSYGNVWGNTASAPSYCRWDRSKFSSRLETTPEVSCRVQLKVSAASWGFLGGHWHCLQCWYKPDPQVYMPCSWTNVCASNFWPSRNFQHLPCIYPGSQRWTSQPPVMRPGGCFDNLIMTQTM